MVYWKRQPFADPPRPVQHASATTALRVGEGRLYGREAWEGGALTLHIGVHVLKLPAEARRCHRGEHQHAAHHRSDLAEQLLLTTLFTAPSGLDSLGPGARRSH